MKIVAYTPLHYGREYLGYAARSVMDYVDEWHVLYTPRGSYTAPGAHCPESRDELYAIAQDAAGGKLRWHEGRWGNEGDHRNSIATYAPDADALIALDADEIWPEGLIAAIIDDLLSPERRAEFPRVLRIPMIHYWKSFYRAVLHDPAYPGRVIITARKDGEMQYGHCTPGMAINHMGYAQTPEVVGYKMTVHGHLNEIKTGWFEDVYLDKNRTVDLHPVGSEYWNSEAVNPWEWMPELMKAHPFADLDIIS